MAHRVYSKEFIAVQGLVATLYVIVPAGHTYVVKHLSLYGDITYGEAHALFKRQTGNVSLAYFTWGAFNRKDYQRQECTYVFEEGTAFGFDVSVALGDALDCYCAGFDLLN